MRGPLFYFSWKISEWVLIGAETLTIKLLKIGAHKKFAVINLKFEQGGFTKSMHPKDADGMANSVDPEEQSDCTVCPGISVQKLSIIMVKGTSAS